MSLEMRTPGTEFWRCKSNSKSGAKSTLLSTPRILIRNGTKTTCLLLYNQEHFEDMRNKQREREKARWALQSGRGGPIIAKYKRFDLSPLKSSRQQGKAGLSHKEAGLRHISSFVPQNTLVTNNLESSSGDRLGDWLHIDREHVFFPNNC